MSTTVDLAQGAELCVGGATVGIFLPEEKVRELSAARESLQREVEGFRQELERLRREAEEGRQARKELDAVRSERDQYASSLTAVMRNLVPVIGAAEAEALIAEAEKDGVDFGEAVRQIEEMMWEKSGGRAMPADPGGTYRVSTPGPLTLSASDRSQRGNTNGRRSEVQPGQPKP